MPFIQYPPITVCISRNTGGVDLIDSMSGFPKEPRNDLVQDISFYRMSNGSYEKHNININGRGHVSKELFYTHLIVFGNYMGSCITFTAPGKVLAGSQHNVSFSDKARFKIILE